MEHSEKYEVVKDYYDKGMWKKKAVRNAVVRAWITAEEYKDITGEDYDG